MDNSAIFINACLYSESGMSASDAIARSAASRALVGGVLQCAGGLDDGSDAIQLIEPALENRIANDFAVFFGTVLHGIDEWQRCFAFGEVVTDVLAELFRGGIEVEGIVDQLERRAQMSPVFDHGCLDGGALAAKNGGDLSAGLKQARGLSIDHLPVVVLCRVRIVHVH